MNIVLSQIKLTEYENKTLQIYLIVISFFL